VTKRARLGRLHELEEERTLEAQTFVEGLRQGEGGDRLDALQRSRQVARRGAHASCARTGRKAYGVRIVDAPIAHARQRTRSPRRATRPTSIAAATRVVLDDGVEPARFSRDRAPARLRRSRSC
jgi:hypothetical protein